jgi:hypothetical protein
MMDIIVSIVEWILEFIADAFGSGCQFLAGVMFDSIDKFMGSDQNVIIKILSPVYNFSVNYLVPFSVSLMVVLIVYNLLLTMFGKYSTSRDEPVTLMARGFLFAMLIVASTSIIGVIGGTADTSNGKSKPGVVLQLASAMADVGTSNDSLGRSGLTSTKKSTVAKDIKKTLSNGKTTVENFAGYTTDKSDSDEGSEYTVTEKGNNKKGKVASAIATVGIGSTNGGFAGFLIILLVYVLVYGGMVLIMMWKCAKICSRFVYRFVIFLVLLYMAPVTLACAPSKSTQRIFAEWLKMIASYAVLLITTAAFMRVGTVVIYQSFHYAGSTDLIQVVFSFLVAIMFLKMIYDLEKYIEKLGLTAVGLPDSVSGLSKEIGSTVNMLKHSLMREGVKSALDHIKGVPSKPDFTVKSPSTVTDKSINDAFGQGIKNYDKDGNEINTLASEMLGKENDNAFISDPNGENMLGTDGIMHNISEFEADADGNMVLKDDDSIMADDQSMMNRYSIADTGIDTDGLDGLDDTSNAFTNVSDTPEGTVVVPDENGNCFLSDTADGKVAVRKSDLDDSNLTEYALKSDEEGNYSAAVWHSKDDGDKFRLGKDGNFVNIGNGQSYSFGKATDDNATPIKYTSTSKDSSKCVNAKSNRIETKIKYNNNLPDGAKISSINNLEYCSTLYEAKDGTTTGIARQMLVDPKTGRPTGQSRYVKFTRYDNNEINKDEIAKHRRTTNREKSDRNPCEGYTPDGKHYLHIEKYMGERKKPTIQKYKGV